MNLLRKLKKLINTQFVENAKENKHMEWKLDFTFKGYENKQLTAIVTADTEENAILKFKLDYPNIFEYIVTKVERL